MKSQLHLICILRCSLLQSPSPNPSNGSPHRPAPERPPKPKFSPKPPVNGIYPQIGGATNKDNDESGDRDYEVLSLNARIRPTRPAPQPPTSALPVVGSTPVYGTLPGSSDLDGVPFALNPRLIINHSDSASVSTITRGVKLSINDKKNNLFSNNISLVSTE